MRQFQINDEVWIVSRCKQFVRLYSANYGRDIINSGWHSLNMFNANFQAAAAEAK